MDAANGGLNMAEIDMTAPTVEPKVGEYAKDRRGVTHGPFYRDYSGVNAVVTCKNTGMRWARNGASCGKPVWTDLVAIIPAPDIVEPDATQEAGVVEVIACIAFTHDGEEYQLTDEEAAGFNIRTEGGTATMSKPAAIAIARAILRMAGEIK
jgi:hypothetical protein